jgi:hypothetical protein
VSTPTARRLHEQLHRLPGMPPHANAARLNQNQAARRPPGRRPRRPARAGHHPSRPNPGAHHARPPRVLAGWVGGLFTSRGNRG